MAKGGHSGPPPNTYVTNNVDKTFRSTNNRNFTNHKTIHDNNYKTNVQNGDTDLGGAVDLDNTSNTGYQTIGGLQNMATSQNSGMMVFGTLPGGVTG